jgi:hypothetical protein
MNRIPLSLRTLPAGPGRARPAPGPFSTALARQLDSDRVRYDIRYLHRPGRKLDDRRLQALVSELRHVAMSCFEDVPAYQCLTGDRAELAQNVLTCAYRPDGTMAGFCSAVILPVPGVGVVLHLGLTCVHPSDRGTGLTHKLTSALTLQYLLRRSPFGRHWITNCACVLSSLGNVALHFEQVYPSPFVGSGPSESHRRIAEEVDRHHRARMFVAPEVPFDREKFVFRGSVRNTVFQKSSDDARFHHRDPRLNDFYRQYMNINDGDEALQVGWVNLLAYPSYLLRKWSQHQAQA